MKCDEFRDRVWDEVPTGPDGELSSEMAAHAAECGACREYYEEIASTVAAATPQMPVRAPGSLKANVMREAARTGRRRRPVWKKAMRVAAVAGFVAVVGAAVVGALLYTPQQSLAAMDIYGAMLARMDSVHTMVMTLEVRTDQEENFASINTGAPLVPHTMEIIKDDPVKWRLEKKGGRTAVSDGEKTYMWDEHLREGWVTSGSGKAFIEWFGILLDPVIERTLAFHGRSEMVGKMEDNGDVVLDAVVTPPEIDEEPGDDKYDYLRNTSLEMSKTRRKYVMDADWYIKSIEIYVIDQGVEILVVRTAGVVYDLPLDEARVTAVPENIEWHDMDAIPSDDYFSTATAEEAARTIFEAMGRRDFASIAVTLGSYNVGRLEEAYGGLRVARIGEAFRSTGYAGVFVPYAVVMPDGRLEKHNIALRNDNPGKVWQVDGGI